jgi:hypothetical protein
MGAHNIDTIIKKPVSEDELRKIFQEMREQARYEYGADSYNGSWSTIQSVKISTRSFPNTQDGINAANDYCLEHARKWQYAVAVRLVKAQDAANKKEALKKKLEGIREKKFAFAKKTIDAAKASKSKTFKCRHCESRIAKHPNFMRKIGISWGSCYYRCPVCENNLFTDSQQKRLAKFSEAETECKAQIEAETNKQISAAQGGKVEGWLIAGWAAS